MWRHPSSAVVIGLFSLLASFAIQAADETTTTTVVEKRTLITPAPKAASCYSVAGHWEGAIWVDTHEVCKYENRTEGVAWVNDYWSCTVANADGSCTSWVLVPGHWIKTLE